MALRTTQIDYAVIADRYIPREAVPAYEPDLAEQAEMRSAFLLSEITEWCRGQDRDALKATLNTALYGARQNLKVIRWNYGF